MVGDRVMYWGQPWSDSCFDVNLPETFYEVTITAINVPPDEPGDDTLVTFDGLLVDPEAINLVRRLAHAHYGWDHPSNARDQAAFNPAAICGGLQHCQPWPPTPPS